MSSRRRRITTDQHGVLAWLALTAYVTTYDVWAARTGRETLSSAFYRAVKHPRGRWPVLAVWAYLTAHLFKLVPDRLDPLRRWVLVEANVGERLSDVGAELGGGL